MEISSPSMQMAVKLTDYNDSSFAYGHIGLYTGTQSEGNVTIGFDNLKVWGIK